MRNIKRIVVHCTDSEDSIDVGFREINDWHKERGWLSPSGISCGYHYIIRRNGAIENGRPEEERGAHVKGHNTTSIGVVWVGRKTLGPTQKKELCKLLRTLINKHKLSPLDIWGHYELSSNKTCPNLDMDWLRAEVLFELEEV
jgi:N-acetylmuramoyl-L-alanine amidase